MSSHMKEENQAALTQVIVSPGKLESQDQNYFRRFSAFIKEARGIFRASGFKGLFAKYRWKMVAVFFTYYLIRDSFLYILLPYLAWKGIW